MKLTLLPIFAAVCGVFIIINPACAQIAVSWQKTSAPNLLWVSIAASADGAKLVACQNNGLVYTSTDSGVTWTPTTLSAARGGYGPHMVASSADGQKLAVISSPNGTIAIYTSTDSGATWTARNAIGNPNGLTQWSSIACSADGSKLVATTHFGNGGGDLYTSSDSGINWTIRFSGYSFADVASSADGTKLVAVVGDQNLLATGNIYTSSDSGTNWTGVPYNYNILWTSVACSSDGTKLFATEVDYFGNQTGAEGQTHYSSNSGATWDDFAGGVGTTPLLAWSGVACSTNGSRAVAVSTAVGGNGVPGLGLIYSTTNLANTWQLSHTTNEPNDGWTSVACSADGSKFFAVAYYPIGAIYSYTAPSTNAPALNIATAGGNSFLSWRWPSTGFALQQNTNLATTNWVNVSGTAAVVNQVIAAQTNANNFYRLMSP